MTRTFGIELELFLPTGKTHADLAAYVRDRALVMISASNYTHAATAFWKVVTDGSLGDYARGAEVVSPILRGEEGIAEARRVCAALTDFGCSVSVKTGFHVHIGIADYTADHTRNLALYYAANEAAIDMIMPPSRRANANSYIRSQLSAFAGATDAAKFNAARELLKGARTTGEVIHRAVSGAERGVGTDRYRKLNFQSYTRQRTVEFRQHSGTVDADKVEHWVRLCMAMVCRAPTAAFKTRKAPKNDPARKAAAPTDLAFWTMLRDLGLSPETQAFFKKRRRELKKADALRVERRNLTRRERAALAAAGE